MIRPYPPDRRGDKQSEVLDGGEGVGGSPIFPARAFAKETMMRLSLLILLATLVMSQGAHAFGSWPPLPAPFYNDGSRFARPGEVLPGNPPRTPGIPMPYNDGLFG